MWISIDFFPLTLLCTWYVQLLSDWVQQYSTSTGIVLDQGRQVFVYSGKNDYVCNYIGGAEWTKATQWRNQVTEILNLTLALHNNKIIRP